MRLVLRSKGETQGTLEAPHFSCPSGRQEGHDSVGETQGSWVTLSNGWGLLPRQGAPQSHFSPFLAQRGLHSLWPPCAFLINLLCCVGSRSHCPPPAPFSVRQSKQGCVYGVPVVFWALGYSPTCIVSFMLTKRITRELIFLLFLFFKNLSSFVHSSGYFVPSTGMPLKASPSSQPGGPHGGATTIVECG